MSSPSERNAPAEPGQRCPDAPRKPRGQPRTPARDRSLSSRRVLDDAEEEAARYREFRRSIDETLEAARQERLSWEAEARSGVASSPPAETAIPIVVIPDSPEPPPPMKTAPVDNQAPGVRRKRAEEAEEVGKRACARAPARMDWAVMAEQSDVQKPSAIKQMPSYAAVTTAAPRHSNTPFITTTAMTTNATEVQQRPAPAPPSRGAKGNALPATARPEAVASTSQTSHAPNATPAAQPASPPPPSKERYPPIVLESFPNGAKHLRALKEKLGRPPSVRPFNKGVRFTPTDGEEYRAIQAYFSSLDEAEKITWFSYSLPKERCLKIAIRGLPADTRSEEIKEELISLGFEPEHVKKIAARQGRPGCIYFAQLKRTPNLTPGIYEVEELLCMPGVKLEHWRGRRGPAQCHRCQAFRHSSHNCFRRQACVRCGGEHYARDCPRPIEDPPTCANCGGAHTANNPRCAVFREEARNKRAGTTALTTRKPQGQTSQRNGAQQQPTVAHFESTSTTTLMAAANNPPPRGDGHEGKKKKKKKKKKGKRQGAAQPPAQPATAQPKRAEGAPRAPAARPRQPATPVSLPRESETEHKKTRTAAELELIETALCILQDVLLAIREGADPTPLVLAGVGRLLSCR